LKHCWHPSGGEIPPPWPHSSGQSAQVRHPPGRIRTNRQRNDFVKRRRTLALHFPVDKWHTPDDLVVSSAILAKEYARLSSTTLRRDLTELDRLDLIVRDKDKYKGNIEIMRGYMPQRKARPVR